jgi:hypothetical protein
MEKKFTVTHKQKQVDCRMEVFNRNEPAPKSQQIKGMPPKTVEVWTVNCWVEGKEITELQRKFYEEQTLLASIVEIEMELNGHAKQWIEDALKVTVSDRLSQLGFK